MVKLKRETNIEYKKPFNVPLLRLERTLAKPELATKKSPQVSTNAKKKYGPWPSESCTSDDGVYIYKKI